MGSMDQQQLLERIRAAYPDLPLGTARLHTAEGQFNDILIVDEALVFRFPRTPQVAATLAAETELLTRLQGHLPLPIPNPIYQVHDRQTGALLCMGYPMLPGQPLWRQVFEAIAGDQVLLTITGIIDFGFAGLGDPTLDVAALAASYGEAFVQRCTATYPAIEQMLPRARLYQGTFALQQALYALRDGNQEDFADGIAAYV